MPVAMKHKILLADTVPERFTMVHCTLLVDWWLRCGQQVVRLIGFWQSQSSVHSMGMWRLRWIVREYMNSEEPV